MNIIALLSSGIDSPVAVYLLSNYIDEIIFMHADGRPYTDDKEIQNFITLADHLQTIIRSNTKRCVLPHGKALEAYKTSNNHPRFTCIFCKRMMVRYANELAKRYNAHAIVMGDSLGQVASQTLSNIQVIDDVSTIPILRPLIGYDKEEIVQIAKDIGTYDLSILDSIGCTAVPQKPATRAQQSQLNSIESIMEIDSLIYDVVDNLIWI